MSYLDLFTWASIAVLIGGSSLVFAWFLRDVRRLYRRFLPPPGGGGRSRPPPEENGEA